MAYVVFNMISTGSDLNAGSTTANSALVTDVGGTYNQGTGAGGTDQYVASSGTPFSATVVGEYVSIYTAAAAATTFVGKITAVNGGGASLDISLTIIYGTRPANASTKTAKTGGAWASHAAISTLGSFTVPQSTEVDIKQATYTITGTTTWAMSGTTTKPVWFRGYNTTVGDLDNGSTTLSYPLFSAGANTFSSSCANALFTGLSFSANRNGAAFTTGGGGSPTFFQHCIFTNTNSGSAAAALNSAAVNSHCTQCYFSTPSTASQIVTSGALTTFQGCWFAGANTGTTQVGLNITVSGCYVLGCHFDKCGAQGIVAGTNQQFLFIGNTFNACLSESIKISGNLLTNSRITNNYFYKSGTYDLNITGTFAFFVYSNNVHNQPGTAANLGLGDWAETNALTETLTPPFVSATDLHLIPSSVGANAGIPGQWENQTAGLNSQPDVGAWQRTVPFVHDNLSYNL